MTLLINSTHYIIGSGVVLFVRRTGDVIVEIMMLRSINFIYLFVTNRGMLPFEVFRFFSFIIDGMHL